MPATTASERSENRSSPGLHSTNRYIRRVFRQGSIPKYSPASPVYALFVLNAKEFKKQNRVSHYGSTFEAVLHLRRTRPPSEFSQYLSCPWPRSVSASSPSWKLLVYSNCKEKEFPTLKSAFSAHLRYGALLAEVAPCCWTLSFVPASFEATGTERWWWFSSITLAKESVFFR